MAYGLCLSRLAAPHTSSQVSASSTLSSGRYALCSADVENVFIPSARLLSAVFQLLLPNELLTNLTQPVTSNSVIVLLSKFYSTVPNTVPTSNPTFWFTSSAARVGPDFGKPRTCTSEPTILVLL